MRATRTIVEYINDGGIVQGSHATSHGNRLSRSSDAYRHTREGKVDTRYHIDESMRRDTGYHREVKIYSNAPQKKPLQLKEKEKQQKFKKRNNQHPPDDSKPFNDKAHTPHLMKLARKVTAEETMQVLKRGWYTLEKSSTEEGDHSITEMSSIVDINEQIKQAIRNAVCYPPEDNIGNIPTISTDALMMVEVVDDTTLNCCKRIWKEVSAMFLRNIFSINSFNLYVRCVEWRECWLLELCECKISWWYIFSWICRARGRHRTFISVLCLFGPGSYYVRVQSCLQRSVP